MSPAPALAVAYSGGRDSTALLHAAARAAKGLGVQVYGLHVHHGLSPHADAWLHHCQQQCERWAAQGMPVRLLHHRLDGSPAKGESVEAWARSARYQSLGAMARERGVQLILLAHHRRDQAETWLLQALRGAGVAGLAAMPASVVRDELRWVRPWLNQPREAIDAYLRAHALNWIEDDSNSDARFARNRLRLSLWPQLLAAFPQAESALARSAEWAQEALHLQQEMAQVDLQSLCDAQGLRIKEWLSLSPARRSNALRAWLQQVSGRSSPASLVQRLSLELPHGKAPASWSLREGVLRRYRGRLRFDAEAAAIAPVTLSESISIRRAGRYRLTSWGGSLLVQRVAAGGVPLAMLEQAQLRERQGGEQFQLAPRSSARSLKKAFQAAGIAAWERSGPLLFAGEQLLFVPGLGMDARALAPPGVAQVCLSWVPDPRPISTLD